jgi:hypothetical protein
MNEVPSKGFLTNFVSQINSSTDFRSLYPGIRYIRVRYNGGLRY